MTGKRRLVLWVLGVIGVSTFLLYMVRDLGLQKREAPSGLKALPDVEAEGLSLARTVGGVEWRMTSRSAVKAGGTIKAKGLTVLKGPQGSPSGKLEAEEGSYDEDLNSVELKELWGVWTLGGRRYELSGDRGVYSFQEDVWHFDGGVQVRRDRMSARGDRGTVEGSRRVVLEGNVELLMEVR